MKMFIVIYLVIFSLLASAQVPNKDDQPRWSCEGVIKIYNKTNSSGERWKTLNEFKLEGPTGKSNITYTEILMGKNKALVKFTHNPKGSSYFLDDKTPMESVSTSIKINSEEFDGGVFSAVDNEDLPKKLSLRQDFKFESISHIFRMICKRNSSL